MYERIQGDMYLPELQNKAKVFSFSSFSSFSSSSSFSSTTFSSTTISSTTISVRAEIAPLPT